MEVALTTVGKDGLLIGRDKIVVVAEVMGDGGGGNDLIIYYPYTIVN